MFTRIIIKNKIITIYEDPNIMLNIGYYVCPVNVTITLLWIIKYI